MAKLKEIEVSSATSIELNGAWYKFSCAARIALEEDDDAKKVKKMAWNTVNSEIEKQVDATLKELEAQ